MIRGRIDGVLFEIKDGKFRSKHLGVLSILEGYEAYIQSIQPGFESGYHRFGKDDLINLMLLDRMKYEYIFRVEVLKTDYKPVKYPEVKDGEKIRY